MIYDEDDGFVPGLIVGVIIMAILFIFVLPSNWDDVKELGQAICEEEYNMDYKSYNNAELKCKPKETKNETLYDDIVIQVGGG